MARFIRHSPDGFRRSANKVIAIGTGNLFVFVYDPIQIEKLFWDKHYGTDCTELGINRIGGGSAKKPGGGFTIMSDGKLIERSSALTVIF